MAGIYIGLVILAIMIIGGLWGMTNKDKTEIKLHEPKECPFCGSKLSGGGKHRAYYYCGSHIWIEQDKYGVWVLRGHPGICYDKENKNE